MATLTVVSSDKPADRKWGYRFGVDGIVKAKEAQTMLGNLSRSCLDKRAVEGKIRRGKEGGRTVFCARSIRQYLQGLEN
jgi:hypothetical protein